MTSVQNKSFDTRTRHDSIKVSYRPFELILGDIGQLLYLESLLLVQGCETFRRDRSRFAEGHIFPQSFTEECILHLRFVYDNAESRADLTYVHIHVYICVMAYNIHSIHTLIISRLVQRLRVSRRVQLFQRFQLFQLNASNFSDFSDFS